MIPGKGMRSLNRGLSYCGLRGLVHCGGRGLVDCGRRGLVHCGDRGWFTILSIT